MIGRSITRIDIPAVRAEACANILASLPEWFGIAEANMRYVRDAAELDALAAYREGRIVGLLVLRLREEPTSGSTALEVHWLGVRPEHHRQGVGTALVEAARNEASALDLPWITVETLDPNVGDPFYLQSFAFYRRNGFVISYRFTSSSGHKMVRMARQP